MVDVPKDVVMLNPLMRKHCVYDRYISIWRISKTTIGMSIARLTQVLRMTKLLARALTHLDDFFSFLAGGAAIEEVADFLATKNKRLSF